MLRQRRLAARRMQQQQFRQAAGALLERGQIERALRQGLVGARQQENTVGLAQALMRPGAVGRVAAIEHHVMRRFESVEPFRALVAGVHIQHRGARAHVGQGRRQAMRDRGAFQCPLQRHDGEGLGPGAGAAAAGGCRCSRLAICCIRFIITRGWRCDQGLEACGPMRSNSVSRSATSWAECSLAAHDQRHLAHGLAGRRQRHHAPLALAVGDENAQAAGDHQEQGGVILAVALQQRAAGQGRTSWPRPARFSAPRRRHFPAAQNSCSLSRSSSG